jgi:hypothetical protein
MDSSLSVPPTWATGTRPPSPVAISFSLNPSITPTDNIGSPAPTVSSEDTDRLVDEVLNKPKEGQLIEVTSDNTREIMGADIKAATSLKWNGKNVTKDEAVKKIAEAEERVKNGTHHHQWTSNIPAPWYPYPYPFSRSWWQRVRFTTSCLNADPDVSLDVQ